MSRDLGDLGKAPIEVDELTFTWLGRSGFRVSDEAGELVMIEFMERASAIELPPNWQTMKAKDVSPELYSQMVGFLPAIRQFLRRLVHEDDFDELWRLAVVNRQDAMDLMILCQSIVAGAAKRPTKRRSGSLPTPRQGKRKSGAGSSWKVPMRRYEKLGRPDVAEAFLIRHEIESDRDRARV